MDAIRPPIKGTTISFATFVNLSDRGVSAIITWLSGRLLLFQQLRWVRRSRHGHRVFVAIGTKATSMASVPIPRLGVQRTWPQSADSAALDPEWIRANFW